MRNRKNNKETGAIPYKELETYRTTYYDIWDVLDELDMKKDAKLAFLLNRAMNIFEIVKKNHEPLSAYSRNIIDEAFWAAEKWKAEQRGW